MYWKIVVACLLVCAWLGWSIAQAGEPTIRFYDPWWPRARLVIVEDVDAPPIPDRPARRPWVAPLPPQGEGKFVSDIGEYCRQKPAYCSTPIDEPAEELLDQ